MGILKKIKKKVTDAAKKVGEYVGGLKPSEKKKTIPGIDRKPAFQPDAPVVKKSSPGLGSPDKGKPTGGTGSISGGSDAKKTSSGSGGGSSSSKKKTTTTTTAKKETKVLKTSKDYINESERIIADAKKAGGQLTFAYVRPRLEWGWSWDYTKHQWVAPGLSKEPEPVQEERQVTAHEEAEPITPGETQDEVIRLGGDDEISFGESFKEQWERAMGYPIGDPRSLKSTAALAGALGLLSGGLTGGLKTFAGKLGLGGSISQKAGTGVLLTRGASGAIVGVAANSKTAALSTSILSKVFSWKGLALMGGWASLVFLGKWAEAESGEPISIALRDLRFEAEKSGDWTEYDEAVKYAKEFTDVSLWEKIIGYTPIGTVVNIAKKLEGVRKGIEVQEQVSKMQRERAESGESDEEYWDRINKENDERRQRQREDDAAYWDNVKKENLQYQEKLREMELENRKADERYWKDVNEQRLEFEKQIAELKKQKEPDYEKEKAYWEDVSRRKREDLEFEAELKKEEREHELAFLKKMNEENAAYWKEQRRLQSEARKKQMEEDLKYWEEVRRAWAKYRLDNMQSNLGFGLL